MVTKRLLYLTFALLVFAAAILAATKPTISSFSPANATAGGAAFTLTVNGTGYASGASVRWNGSDRTTTFVSATQLTAQITAADIQAGGLFPITIRNTTGPASDSVNFTVSNPVPTLTSISPTTATAGGATFTLTVTGTNFNSSSVVRFNGNNKSTTFVSATQLTAQITSSDVPVAGAFPVTVSSPSPGGGISSAINVDVSNPIPAVSSLSPSTAALGGAAFTLTVNGSNFVNGSVVRFEGSDRVTTFVSATKLTAQILATDIQALGTYAITVINPAPGGGASSAVNLAVVNPVPSLTSVSPASKTVGDGDFTLTVNGTKFVNGALVIFNGSTCATTFVNSTQLTAQISHDELEFGGIFAITVVNPTPGGGSSSVVNFTVNNPPPTLSSISQTSAIAGDAAFNVTVTGSNFVYGSVLRFNGHDCATTYDSRTQLSVQIAAADIQVAGLFPITVASPSPGGGLSGALDFTVNNPAPTLSSLSPTTATAGDASFTVTIAGMDFNSGSVVRFNGSDRPTTFVNTILLTAQLTAADVQTAGAFPITVFNPTPGGGTSSAVDFTVNNSVPAVTSVSPATAILGGDALTLTVNGSNFVNGSVVKFNGNDHITTFVNATQLTAQIPASDLQATGTFSITVFSPTPGGGTSAAVEFTVNNPAPTFGSLSPSSATAGGVALTVTVNGNNFVNGAVVRINGANRPTNFVSSTEVNVLLTATDIEAAGLFPLTVVNPAPGGGVSSAVDFTVNNRAPALSSISPTSKTAGEATFTITVNGSNFVNNSVVRINGADRPTSFVSVTELTAQLTAVDIQAGGIFPLTVANPAPGGGVSSAVDLTVNNPAPTLSSISPSSAIVGDAAFTLALNGSTLALNGSNFVNGAVVRFNGSDRSTSFVSSTQVTVQLTAADMQAAGLFPLTVANPAPGGGTSSAVDFTVNNPAPILSAISPTAAVAGGAAFTLTVNGSGFVNGSVVRFNGSDRFTSFVSDTQLNAQISAADIQAVGTANIVIFNPLPSGGSSGAVSLAIDSAIPVLTTLSPSSILQGGPASALTIGGTGFNAGSVVRFNGSDRPTTFVSDAALNAQITAADIVSIGQAEITVVNPVPGGLSNALPLTIDYNPAVHRIVQVPNTTFVTGENNSVHIELDAQGDENALGLSIHFDSSKMSFVSATAGADTSTPSLNVNLNQLGQGRVGLALALPVGETFTAGHKQILVVTFNVPASSIGQTAIDLVDQPVQREVVSSDASSLGATYSAGSINIQYPTPILAAISHDSMTAGGSGFSLTVSGSKFVDGAVVRLNGNDRPTTFVSSNQLIAQISAADVASAGIGAITVLNPAPSGGSSNAVNFTVNNPAPTLGGVSPNTATAGEAALTIVINGTNFNSSSVASFNGHVLPTTLVSATQLTAQLTAADIQAAGLFSVTIANPAPGGGTSSAVELTVNNPAPTMSSLSPSSAIAGETAFTVTINGANFNSSSVASFNGNARPTTFVSATQLTAQLTAADIQAAGLFSLTVANPAPGGGTSSSVELTVNNPAPTMSSLSPSSAIAGDTAFALTINGANFNSSSQASFNGNARPTTFVSATQLTAALTAADIQAAGLFSVTIANPAPGGGTSSAVELTVNNPAPSVSSLSPTSAIAGDTAFALTINGANFNSSSQASFNGNARPTTFVSATQLTAALTAADIQAAGLFSVTIANPAPGGGTSSAVELTVNNPAPSVSSLSPTSAIAGDTAFTVTINGANFNSSSQASFNGNARPTTFVSATQLTAALTAADIQAAGLFSVTIANPAPGGGTSSAVELTVNNPAPSVSSLSPTSAIAGDTAFTVTINGANFNSSSQASFNGNARPTTFVSATQLTAQLTAADIQAAGLFSLTVANPAPGGGTSSAVELTVNNPAPTMSSLSQSGATRGDAPFVVTVSGTNFVNSSVVKFNGNNRVTSFIDATHLSAQLTAADLATTGTFSVVVSNPAPGGGSSNTLDFTVNNPAPVISSLASASAIAGGGAFTLTINGSNFVNDSVVKFNGSSRSTSFVNNTQISAQITAADIQSAGTAGISVVNPAPGGGSSNTLNFSINNPVPAVTTLSPATAIAGEAGFTLIVNGTNFIDGSTILWNGTSRVTSFVNSSQLTAQITAGDIQSVGTAAVSVQNAAPGGGTSAAATFSILASNAVPQLSSVTPVNSIVGTGAFSLTVNGSGFFAGSVVRWNGTNRVTNFISATQLTAQITAVDVQTAGTAHITVSNPPPGGGESNTLDFAIIAPNGLPTINALTPASATVGSSAFTITVDGSDFVNGAVVRWNGSDRATVFVSSSQLTAQITAADLSSVGTAAVTVFNPIPGGGVSGALTFAINAPQPDPPQLQFSAANFSISEGGGSAVVTVTRSGDTSGTAAVDFTITDPIGFVPCDIASGHVAQNCDYTLSAATLRFAVGETTKSTTIPIIDDAYVEGDELLNIRLTNATGASLGSQSTATLTINDNDSGNPTAQPIDDARLFVRQQYLDFLSREPDQGGWDFWTGQITSCPPGDAQCVHDRRVRVADAFFFEPEFQESGAYVYRLYRAGLGLMPTYAQFQPDRAQVLGGVNLDQSKTDFALNFVRRDAFLQTHAAVQTAEQFVDQILAGVLQTSSVDLASVRPSLLALYDNTDTGRARILRQIADNQAFIDAEYNRSFVLNEYFGYLRRDPDQGGFDFWLGQVNRYPLRDTNVQHAMVCSFITSAEYQLRFSTVITSTNSQCPQ